MEEIDFERRFSGIKRLYGEQALRRFQAAHVCVIGVGGVGSWAAEALARSAIGKLTLIDLDNVAESNINRQIQSLTSTLGAAKVTALAERIAQINPMCEVIPIEDFVTADNLFELIKTPHFDYVIDAIDHVKPKAALLAFCKIESISVVTIGAAGGQINPGLIEICDLSQTEQDPLLASVRSRLRQRYGFPRRAKKKFGIDAVFSKEPLIYPDVACDVVTEGLSGLNCAGFGSSMAVTASFGLRAAALVLNKLGTDF